MKRKSAGAVGIYLLLCVLLGITARGLCRPGFLADGVGYYAPLASLLVDDDLDLHNELSQLNRGYLRAAFMTPEGQLGNPFPVGPAILWAPAVYLVSHLPAVSWLDAPLKLRPRTRHPAFAPRYARAVQYSNALLVLVGGSFLVWVLASLVPWWLAAMMITTMVWATPVFYYVLVEASYGHAASFFAVALLTAAALRDARKPLPIVLLGILWGLVALVRSQDAVFGLLLAPRLFDSFRAAGTRRQRIILLLRFLVPALVMFAPQMLFWIIIYGRPLLIPPGPDVLPFWKPQLLHLLFSTWNGVVPWAPLLLIGSFGLAFLPDRRWRIFAWIAITLQLYTSAILLDWWGGGSFGPRRLVSIAPLAGVGLAFLVQRLLAKRSLPARFAVAAFMLFLAISVLVPIRIAEFKLRGYIPNNPGNAAEYVRHYTPGSPSAMPWGHLDYLRGLRELKQAARLREIDRKREQQQQAAGRPSSNR